MTPTALPIRLVLADDHELFRDGFRVMLKKQPGLQLVADAPNGAALIDAVRTHRPDVIITDIKMPVMDGIAATRQLISQFPDIPVIALSMFDEENLIVDMLEAGARGYLIKNASKEEIIAAITAVYQGDIYYCNNTSRKLTKLIAHSNFNPHKKQTKAEFSDRELEVMRLVCQERSNKEIASELNISVRTVEGHRERIQEKISARNMAGIVVYAIKHRIFSV